jgi:DNA adenine methylase
MRTFSVAMRPLLRWAGSKRRILPILEACAPAEYRVYIEPFAGSACFFVKLRPKRSILGDVNRDLIAFYGVIADMPRELEARVVAMPKSESFYYELRQKHELRGRIDKAARFFYLNRFCFNGVYRTDKQGRFNVPRGIKVGSMPNAEDCVAFSRLLRNATLLAGDFEECMERARSGDFAYLDPPYTTSSRLPRGEYGYDSFRTTDLDRLIRCLRKADKRGVRVLLSYRKDPELAKALKGWSCRTLRVRRHVAGFARHRAVTSEVLLANYDLPVRLGWVGAAWAG